MTAAKAAKETPPGLIAKGAVVENLPTVQKGDGVGDGKVYIKDVAGKREFTQGQQLVIERRASKPLYVETLQPIKDLVDDGTYLSAADLQAFDQGADLGAAATARLYNNRDRWARFKKGPELVLGLTVLCGVLAALIAGFNGIFPPPPAIDAPRAEPCCRGRLSHSPGCPH
jgi:hypothetical protein